MVQKSTRNGLHKHTGKKKRKKKIIIMIIVQLSVRQPSLCSRPFGAQRGRRIGSPPAGYGCSRPPWHLLGSGFVL